MVVLDDTGLGQLGCYGSPMQTPNFDALTANGLRYNNMHTTALCSPSRIPEGGAEGVAAVPGIGGRRLLARRQEGRLHYVHNYVGRSLHRVSSREAIPAGAHELRFESQPTGQPDLPHGLGAPGRMHLYVDRQLVGWISALLLPRPARTEEPATT